jgi:hypothetical protein
MIIKTLIDQKVQNILPIIIQIIHMYLGYLKDNNYKVIFH